MEATVIQRGETPDTNEFYFVFEKGYGKGSYVQLEDGVLARVTEVFKSNDYFENPESVSEAINSGQAISEKFPVEDWEVRIARAEILGRIGDFRIERVNSAPTPGTDVEEAEKEQIRELLGLDEEGLNLGSIQQQDIDAGFDMTDMLQKHFSILAQSGAGKSYTASVMIEELLERDYAPSIVCIDPHGDFLSFAEDENYMSDVKVFREDNISIAVRNLSAERIAGFFPQGMSGPQIEELKSVFKDLKRDENSDFGLQTVIDRVEREEMNSKVKYALKRKLLQLKSMCIFGKSNNPSRNDIEPGKLNIIDFSGTINKQKKQIVTSFFAQRFFRLRRQEKIPPFLYLIEEAHNFAPEHTPAPSKSVVEKLAREGRKFQASIGLISQRPVKLSTTALSQCNTKVIMRVTNPNDLEHISQSSEGITSEVTKEIPGMKTGEGIIIGEAVNYPTFIDVRERKSTESDSGRTLEDSLKEWEEQQEQEDKDAEAFM